MIQPSLFYLHPNKYNRELQCYSLAVKLDICVGSWNTLNDLSNKVCGPHKTEDLNTHVFNMIPGKNESKILTKDISCKCTCRFDEKNVIQINSGTSINVDVSIKNVVYVKKIILGILVHVVVKMENIWQVVWMIQWSRVMKL